MPELVTLGETCVALVARSRGPLRHAAEFERRPGGAESTVAAGVARLGHSAGWVSQAGRRRVRRLRPRRVMRSERVDVSAVRMTRRRADRSLLSGQSGGPPCDRHLLPEELGVLAIRSGRSRRGLHRLGAHPASDGDHARAFRLLPQGGVPGGGHRQGEWRHRRVRPQLPGDDLASRCGPPLHRGPDPAVGPRAGGPGGSLQADGPFGRRGTARVPARYRRCRAVVLKLGARGCAVVLRAPA